jgi:hypothetical protein
MELSEKMQRIGDFPFTMAYMAYDSDKYDELLMNKKNIMEGHFTSLFHATGIPTDLIPSIDLISSPPTHLRQKCRFTVGQDDSVDSNRLVHMMWKNGSPTVVVEAFPIASRPIFNMMPILLG